MFFHSFKSGYNGRSSNIRRELKIESNYYSQSKHWPQLSFTHTLLFYTRKNNTQTLTLFLTQNIQHTHTQLCRSNLSGQISMLCPSTHTLTVKCDKTQKPTDTRLTDTDFYHQLYHMHARTHTHTHTLLRLPERLPEATGNLKTAHTHTCAHTHSKCDPQGFFTLKCSCCYFD